VECNGADESAIPRLLYLASVRASDLPPKLQEKGIHELLEVLYQRFPHLREWLQGDSSQFVPMGRGRFNNVVVDFPQRAASGSDSEGGGEAA
jgi:hypothetical protein